MNTLTIIVAVAVVGISDVQGYGSGAPVTACVGDKLVHTNRTSGERIQPLPAAENPFRFVASVTEYIPGEALTISIEGTDGAQIHGFFLQARGVDSNISYGSFTNRFPAKSKVLACQTVNDAVTHTDPTAKGSRLVFTWQAPRANTGSIRFIGSVALNHDEFYTDIESEVIAEGSSAGTVQMSLAVMTMGVAAALFSLISPME
ncbi:reelin domain-containing protein 1-like [Diadema antillarum]|uniref:reelin domain-containing protein 1-like n=1 Tax=Diadema antillarum TaxID=105358 RepID=UPI003A848FF3